MTLRVVTNPENLEPDQLEPSFTLQDRLRALPVPEALRPDLVEASLPAPSMTDLAQLKEGGWSRFGIVAAVTNEKGEVLMLEHVASPKTPEGSLGPLAETAVYRRNGQNGWEVETVAETLRRSLQEEMGIEQPETIGLATLPRGSWTLDCWPVGGAFIDSYAFAVCPVVLVPRESESFFRRFVNTPEIRRAAFIPLEEILAAPSQALREGTQDWALSIQASRLISQRTGFTPLEFSLRDTNSSEWQDADLRS